MSKVFRFATPVFAYLSTLLIGCATSSLDSPETAQDQPLGENRLRLVAGNITSGNGQSYDPGHGIRIFKGTRPDIALVQELNYTAGDRAFVDAAFGSEFQYIKGTGNIPNGVVSRYPILDGGEWDDPQVGDRGFAWARIDVPGPTDLWAVSVHLLTRSSSARDSEARVIRAAIQQVVPEGAWVVIGGDFNTDSRTESALNTLSSVVVTKGPFPVDHRNNGNTNASRGKPYDWVLVSENLDAREIPVEIGNSSFPNGLVVDTRVYSPISELAPAQSSDSGASSMQHMAVVRDFDIPDEVTPTAKVDVDSPNGGEKWAIGSTQSIQWTATNVETVNVEYAADGVTFETIAENVAADVGAVDWIVSGPATTTGRIRVVGSPGSASDISDADLTTVEQPTTEGQIILNEILANEPGTLTTGEFVELVNTSGAAIDLAGWTLADSAATRHRFPAGTTLAPGARLVIFGNTASTGALGLSNSGDTVKLADAAGATIDSHTFGTSPDGVSFNRSPDSTLGTFVLHTELSSQSSSAGSAPTK